MIIRFLKIAAKPYNIAYPFPLVSLFCLTLSKIDIINFFISYLFCFVFFSAINLWNHVNDAELDLKFGKSESKFLIENTVYAVILVLIFYFLSLILIIKFSRDNYAYLTIFILCVFTWLYSDKIFLGKFLRRLKENYKTEILTYIIASFSFPITLWTFYEPINTTGLVFSCSMALLYLSISILKDIKDITLDSFAGYETLAIIFNPSDLLKISTVLYVSSLLLVLFSSLFGIFPPYTGLASLVMLVFVIYILLNIRKHNWKITVDKGRHIKIYSFSYLVTLSTLIIVNLLFKINCNR